MGNSGEGRDFLIGRWKSVGEWFWPFKPIARLKTTSKYWTLIKPKLAWPVCTNSIKLKWRWYKSNNYSEKWSFSLVITWKLLFSGGIKIWWEAFFQLGENQQTFVWWAYEGLLIVSQKGKPCMFQFSFIVSGVSIFKPLQKEEGYPRPVRIMEL